MVLPFAERFSLAELRIGKGRRGGGRWTRGGAAEELPPGAMGNAMMPRYEAGGAFAELRDSSVGRQRRAYVNRLVAGPDSQPGDAGKVMDAMAADADRHGVWIEGEVHPLEGVHARHPMTSEQLRTWYAKWGYKPAHGRPFVVERKPQARRAEFIEAEHPRGKGGRFIELYHGTTAEAALGIEGHGMTADRYSPYNRVLTTRKDEAGYFATPKAGPRWRHGGAVVTVRIPADQAGEYLDQSGPLASLKKPLPASMIHQVEYLDGRPPSKGQASLLGGLKAALTDTGGGPGGGWTSVEDIPTVGESIASKGPRQRAVNAATKAQATLDAELGTTVHGWNGRVALDPTLERQNLAGVLDWDGTMRVGNYVTDELDLAATDPHAPIRPDALAVLTHEMIHGEGDDREPHAVTLTSGTFVMTDSQVMYSQVGGGRADQEEGFTELGTAFHAPEVIHDLGYSDRRARGGDINPPPHDPLYDTAKHEVNADDAAVNADMMVLSSHAKDPVKWLQGSPAAKAAADLHIALDEDEPQRAAEAAGRLRAALAAELAKPGADDYLKMAKANADRLGNSVAMLTAAPAPKFMTVGEYAELARSPEGLNTGGWGHYPSELQRALAWELEIAKLEGGGRKVIAPNDPRIVALSDEVNRVGTDVKGLVLAKQLLRARGVSATEDQVAHLDQTIADRWKPYKPGVLPDVFESANAEVDKIAAGQPVRGGATAPRPGAMKVTGGLT